MSTAKQRQYFVALAWGKGKGMETRTGAVVVAVVEVGGALALYQCNEIRLDIKSCRLFSSVTISFHFIF